MEFVYYREKVRHTVMMVLVELRIHRLLADQQVPGACIDFASHYKQLLKEKKLQRNFIQHLVSLQQFELLSPAVIHQAVTILLTSNEADTSVTR